MGQMRHGQFRSRTVYPKQAVCHPSYLEKMVRELMPDLRVEGGIGKPRSEEKYMFRGMEVIVRDDVPPDKIYIMPGRPYEEPIFEQRDFTPMEYSADVPTKNPLALLHDQVEGVCRLARA